MPGLSELQHRINERIKATPPVRVIVISFVLIILVGTLLLMLPISSKVGGATPIDALFTITSATCVTGLVVGDTFTLWTPFGQGVILACIQLGGLGLSTLAIGFSLLVRRKLGIREMKLASESSGGSGLDIALCLRGHWRLPAGHPVRAHVWRQRDLALYLLRHLRLLQRRV